MSRYSDAIERIEEGGFVAELHYDTDPTSPKDWDNVGTLITWHRSEWWDEDGRKAYDSPLDFKVEAEEKGWVYINVGLHSHGMDSFYEGTEPVDAGGWDSGQVGFLYITKERLKTLGMEEYDKDAVQRVLRSELQTWDEFVRGQVYGYTITGPDGEQGDSCWGFYGLEYAIQEMKDALKYTLEQERKAEEMVKNTFAL